jgi:threonine dehydrogenase-like Zn-dependent dehydrogenase
VGQGVTGLEVGTRVAFLSERAYAEYDVAPATSVVPLPPSLDGRPFPGEALGCALNVFRRSEIRAGQTVAVVGVGFLGALVTALAARAGARVLAISRRPFSLEVARASGAAEVIALEDTWGVMERVRALTGGEGCDRVIEAVGLQGPLDLAGELTRERGRLVIAGYHQDGTRRVNLQLWNWRGLDVINAHERDPVVYLEGIRGVVAAVEAGTLEPWSLLTHTFELDRLDEALAAAHERPAGFLKAMIAL